MRKRSRSITCTCGGMQITAGETPSSPLFLLDADGLYNVKSDVNITENTLSDGGVYQSSLIKPRNITLTIRDKSTDDHIAMRNTIFSVFRPGAEGRLRISDVDGDTSQARVIDYYSESLSSDGLNSSREYNVSLICPDPYFYADADTTINMATWMPVFQFVHAFAAAGEEFGYRAKKKNVQITNISGAGSTGFQADIDVLGAAQNPALVKVETGERIKLGTSGSPLSLQYGDKITITTGTNSKHCYLTRDGVKTEINQYLDPGSVLFPLDVGIQTIGYEADSGIDNLSVRITYRMRYTHA